jgi:hypothetical protein
MARGYTSRRIEVFSLHAHITIGQVDYGALFRALAAISDEERVYKVEDKLVAVPTFKVQDGYVRLVAFEGDTALHPLLYNYESGTARIQPLRSGEMVATKTHGLINIEKREAIIEYNQRGAKASDISQTLEYVGRTRTNWHSLKLELVPKAEEGFVKSIERFERIRVASFKVTRPNPSWTDHFDHLNDLAEQSDAGAMEVTATAERGESLSQSKGVVAYIKNMARQSLAYVKGANLIGTRPGEKAETSISLNRYIEHQRVGVKTNEDGHVNDDDLERKIRDYAKAREQGNDKKP